MLRQDVFWGLLYEYLILVTTEFLTVKNILNALPSACPLPCHIPSRGPVGTGAVGVGRTVFLAGTQAARKISNKITNKYRFFIRSPQIMLDKRWSYKRVKTRFHALS